MVAKLSCPGGEPPSFRRRGDHRVRRRLQRPIRIVGRSSFRRSPSRCEPVILPIFQQSASDQSGRDAIIRSEPAATFSAAWVGGVNIFPGADGVVREYPAATIIGGKIRPSIAALLAESDALGDRSFQPDWGIDAQRIPRFSFVDIVKGRIPREAIAGKRIVIGGTAIELGDRYTVPRYGSVPGVVVQALATESLLQGRTLSRSSGLATLFGIVLVGLILGAGRFRRFNRSFPPAALTVILLLAVGPVLIQARWPFSIDSVAMLFSAVGCVAMRVLIEVRRRIAMKSMVDAETNLPNRLALEAQLAAVGDSAPVLATAAIEGFDSIRDAIGTHAVTDLVRLASARIERRIDGPVYRIAPDVLAWLQPGLGEGGISNGTLILEIIELFRESVETQEGRVDVRLTIGLDRDPVAKGIVPKIERALAAISTARAAGDTLPLVSGLRPRRAPATVDDGRTPPRHGGGRGHGRLSTEARSQKRQDKSRRSAGALASPGRRNHTPRPFHSPGRIDRRCSRADGLRDARSRSRLRALERCGNADVHRRQRFRSRHCEP